MVLGYGCAEAERMGDETDQALQWDGYRRCSFNIIRSEDVLMKESERENESYDEVGSQGRSLRDVMISGSRREEVCFYLLRYVRYQKLEPI